MCAPRWRSAARPNSAAVSSGNASSTRIDVTRMFQGKIGIRNIVMPGARMQTTVVIMLTPPRMVPRPPTARPMIHRSPPAPGEGMASGHGVYAVPPKTAAPPRGGSGPAEVGGAARGDEAGDRDRRAEKEQPEGEGIQPRKRHVGCADLKGK